jgi:hypothetical protein
MEKRPLAISRTKMKMISNVHPWFDQEPFYGIRFSVDSNAVGILSLAPSFGKRNRRADLGHAAAAVCASGVLSGI